MSAPMKYRLVGKRRRAEGYGWTPFETVVTATGYDAAQNLVRHNWRDIYQSVVFDKVTQIVEL